MGWLVCIFLFGGILMARVECLGQEELVDDCPQGKVDGNVWTMSSDGLDGRTCMNCTCEEDKEICMGCKDDVPDGCQPRVDAVLGDTFPECCPSHHFDCPPEDREFP